MGFSPIHRLWPLPEAQVEEYLADPISKAVRSTITGGPYSGHIATPRFQYPDDALRSFILSHLYPDKCRIMINVVCVFNI